MDGSASIRQGAGLYLSGSRECRWTWVADNAIEPHSDIDAWGVTVWGTGLYATDTVASIENAATGNSATGPWMTGKSPISSAASISTMARTSPSVMCLWLAINQLSDDYTCVGPLMASESTLTMTHGIFP